MTYREWQQLASGSLSHLGNARFESELLLMHVLGIARTDIIAWPDTNIAADHLDSLACALEQRANHVPLPYITGIQEFWSLPFRVTPNVLIPRSDSELLVEIGLHHLEQANKQRVSILDAGTGSGAIALSLASELKQANVFIVASDQSLAALGVARQNADRLRLSNVAFVHGNWLTPFSGESFDLILSNPPYLASDDPHLHTSIGYEPLEALVSGSVGFNAIKQLIAQSSQVLKPGGLLAVEHGFEQGAKAREHFAETDYLAVSTRSDLSGHERVSLGTKP